MITISLGQAILLLISIYKNNAATLLQLKKLYLSGISFQKDYDQVLQLFKQNGLSNQYEISTDPQVISEDPTRRYFETHLAYETLYHSLDHLDLNTLIAHYKTLLLTHSEDKQTLFFKYLNGEEPVLGDRFAQEYIDSIIKIENHESYRKFSVEQKGKLILLMKCSWLGVMHNRSPALPLNIYGFGFFEEKARGKIAKLLTPPTNSTYCNLQMPYYSKNFGLLKHYMFVPKSDIAYADQGFTFIKPSDVNNFNPEAAWPINHFASLIHPFSCGISGTTLMQLRVIKFLHNENKFALTSNESFAQFFKCYMSILLFNSGGHSYHEFFAVFKIPEISNNFKFIDKFDEIDADSLLLSNNDAAFTKALGNTIAYNKVILAHQATNEMIKTTIRKVN